jgi:capsular exopolysaccharide synthesis family protein
MSRFFDALKEASRSRSKPNDIDDVGNWETLVPDAPQLLDANELLKEAMASAAAPAPAFAPAPEREEPPAALPEELLGPVARPAARPVAPKVQISFDPKARLITNTADTVVTEYYRRLRTKILQQQATKPFRILLVVSPSPQEGKTVTVLNLGLSFATLPSFKVLVVDGDLRRGNIGKLLGVENHVGLTNLLDGSATLEDAVLKCEDIPVHFMTRGNSQVPPAELLHSPQLGRQLRRVSEQFDLVLIDSAPVNLITDTQLLAGSSDAILLVARAFSTTRKSLELAVQDLSQFRIIGTVLNGGPRHQVYRRYKGYY